MTTKHYLAALLVAVGAATAFAAPAAADNETDDRFIGILEQEGVPVKTDSEALSLAHTTCQQLKSGVSLQGVLSSVQNATGWPRSDSINFGKYAVLAFCPEAMPS